MLLMVVVFTVVIAVRDARKSIGILASSQLSQALNLLATAFYAAGRNKSIDMIQMHQTINWFIFLATTNQQKYRVI